MRLLPLQGTQPLPCPFSPSRAIHNKLTKDFYRRIELPTSARKGPARTRQGGLRWTLLSRRSFCAKTSRRLLIHVLINRSYLQTDIRRPRRTKRSEHNAPTGAQTILGRSFRHHIGHTHRLILYSRNAPLYSPVRWAKPLLSPAYCSVSTLLWR
jgi:hypothetical protein